MLTILNIFWHTKSIICMPSPNILVLIVFETDMARSAEQNLRCLKAPGICILYPNFLALIVSEIPGI